MANGSRRVIAADTLFVGDSWIDHETALRAGVDICLVRYGLVSATFRPSGCVRAQSSTGPRISSPMCEQRCCGVSAGGDMSDPLR